MLYSISTLLIYLNTSSLVPNSGRYFGNDGLSMVQEIQADNNGDFVVSGLISGSDFTAPQYSNLSNSLLPNLQSRGFFVSKINGLTGDDVWVQQGITTGIGQWTKDICVDANSTIYLTGYLNGTIDFQQGDTWGSTVECDNTYLLKVYDGQNQGVIERLNNSSQVHETIVRKENVQKVYLLESIHELLNMNLPILQGSFCIYDLSGKVIFEVTSGTLKSEAIKDLDNGVYFLRSLSGNESLRFILLN